MKKFISLMNNQSFYYLWQHKEGKKFLLKIISSLIGEQEDFHLLDTFNDNTIYLRSYILLESKKKIIFIDFNHRPNYDKAKLNIDIFKLLQINNNKSIIMIIFNQYPGENRQKDNIYQIYRNKANNLEIQLLLSNHFDEQYKYGYKEMIDYLYNLDDEFYIKYLREINTEENIYNLFDL